MRNLSIEFVDHINSKQTSLVNCWKIIRADNIVLGFTDHDKDLTFDGLVFSPSYGMDSSEIASKLGAQVDTSEILGIVNSAAIDERDILLGRYDDAIVETYKVNWRDVSTRLLLRRDNVGEIIRTDGIFRLELRSSQHGMNINKGRVYQNDCDCSLGDGDCSIDLNQAIYKLETVVVSIRGKSEIAIPKLIDFADNWFDLGFGIWNSGDRTNKKDTIILHQNEDLQSIIGFDEPIDEWVNIGDEIVVFAGCDKRLVSCNEKFSNVLNFRGFPHIPGSDFILRYPKAGSSFDGKPLYR